MNIPETRLHPARRRAISLLMALCLAPASAAAYLPQERTVEGTLERSLSDNGTVIIAGEQFQLHPRVPRPAPRAHGTRSERDPRVGDRVVATVVQGRIVRLERAQ